MAGQGKWNLLLVLLVALMRKGTAHEGIWFADNIRYSARALSIANRGIPTDDDDSLVSASPTTDDDDETGDASGTTAKKEKSPYEIPAADTSDADTSDSAPPKKVSQASSSTSPTSTTSMNATLSNVTSGVLNVTMPTNSTNVTVTGNSTTVSKNSTSVGDDDSLNESEDATETSNFSQWDVTNNTKKRLFPDDNSTITLPKEQQQPDSWPFTVASIFLGLTAVLCALTGSRAYRRYKNRHHGYDEIQNLVV